MTQPPLRFCIVNTFYPPYSFGGDGVSVQRLAVALAERGHHVEVVHSIDAFTTLARKDPAQRGYTDHPAIVHHGLRSRAGLVANLVTQQTARPGLHARRLRGIMRDGRFDVVHFHNSSLIGLTALGYAPNAVRLYTMHEHWLVCPMHVLWRFNREPCPGRKCIRCTIHGRRPPQWWRYGRTLSRSLRHVDAFIAPSLFTRDKHLEFGLRVEAPIVHIPNFLPPPADPASGAATSPASPHPRPYFLYVGRLERIKGTHTLIPAFARFRDADLLIAGTGNDEAMLRSAAAALPHVRFLGHVEYARLQPLMRNAIAVLVPSVGFEVFPTTVLEANAQGTPVIGRRLGPLPEMLDGRGGLTYGDEDEFIAALVSLSHDRARRDALGERGRTAYLAEWTPEHHLRRYFDLIANLKSRPHLFA